MVVFITFVSVVFFAAWLGLMIFLVSGGGGNHNTDPRTHRVEVNGSTYKVCAGDNLVFVSDTGFWVYNPKVISTTLNSAECAK